ALVEVADAAAEEAPYYCPARRDQASREGQAEVDVGPPECVRHWRRRDAELERGDRAARANDPGELPKRRRGVFHVPEQVREGERVEGSVVERQVVGACLDELERRQPAPGHVEHLGAL